jgi:DNA modification methylase
VEYAGQHTQQCTPELVDRHPSEAGQVSAGVGRAFTLRGDARAMPLADASVDLVVTSPPYWSQRVYTDNGERYDGQIGTEATPAEYIQNLLACTAEWVRVLRPSGSMFVNLGDKYGRGTRTTISGTRSKQRAGHTNHCVPSGSPKSLLLLPQRYAIGCVELLGLTVRAEIIWRKTNPIPDPTKDRVGRGHEIIFHLVKSPRYYHAAPVKGSDQGMAVWDMQAGSLRVPHHLGAAHHATFPLELPARAIRRWCPPGGTVLDPFSGSGTTALAAAVMGRTGIGLDWSSDYAAIAQWRTTDHRQIAGAIRTLFGDAKVGEVGEATPTYSSGRHRQLDLFGGPS